MGNLVLLSGITRGSDIRSFFAVSGIVQAVILIVLLAIIYKSYQIVIKRKTLEEKQSLFYDLFNFFMVFSVIVLAISIFIALVFTLISMLIGFSS